MTISSWIHDALSGHRVQRRFSAAGLHARDNNPPAPGQIPSGLTDPTDAIFGPGRVVWKFAAPPVHLHFDKGAIITTARLVPLFWGEFWRTGTNPSLGDIYQAIEQILASPYLSEVMQYGFQSLSLEPATIVISPGPPSPTFSGDDAKNMVWDLIDDDRFPEPDDDGGRIVYMVIAPPGSRYDDGGAAGAHGDASDYDPPFDTDHAWVGWCNYDTLDGITEIFTHELVEILTDPEPYGGWTVEGMPEGNNELVDVCFNETGVVSGYRVSAYYSDRLKACVVPAFPNQYSVSVSTKDERIGPVGSVQLGSTETTKHSICFNGTYGWTVVAQQRRVTVTAAAAGYQEPEFSWKINGVSVFSSGVLGVPTFPITSTAGTALDPLNMITILPPQTATAKVAAAGNVLVLESQAGQWTGDFDVVCTVTEKRLPSGYRTARSHELTVTLAGNIRVMDERFQRDLAACLHLQSVLARKFIEEVVIPRIDLGDPPRVWIERATGLIETEAVQQANETRFLAHFVEGLEPELAETLRHLADGVIALAFAANLTQVEQE